MSEENLLEALALMYKSAGLPAIITDSDFYVIYASDAARELNPGATVPGGVRELLAGHDLDDVRREIELHGSFCIPSVNWMLFERASVLCAVPGGDHYLLQPSPIAPHGSGMRPEGVTRALTAFASQYRTPLSNIFSMLSLIGGSNSGSSASPLASAENGGSEKLSECLRVINDNAYRLLRTSRWITDYSQLSNGIESGHRTRIDLYAFLRELLNAADDHAGISGVTLQAEIPAGSLFTVCDTGLLQNAVLNILSNSYRYTREGNHISVSVWRNNKSLAVSIADKGAGIASDVLPHVFEPYFSRGTDGSPFSGCGLGLTIARDSILAMGGWMNITSDENIGTTVSFTLPVFDDPAIPDTLRSDNGHGTPLRFSQLVIALSDSIRPPI